MSEFKNPKLRYHIIDRELRRWPSITCKRLHEIIQRELDKSITSRMILNDLNTMQEPPPVGFNAPIVKDKRTRKFSYSDRNFSIKSFGLTAEEIIAIKFYAACLKIYSEYSIFGSFSTAINKIVEGVDVKNKFSDKNLIDFVVQTDTLPNAKGSEFLSDIIEAIDNKKLIQFSYTKFNSTENRTRVLAPYMLKEYKNRWYVLGVPEGGDRILTFALDRIQNVSKTDNQFEKYVSFDYEKYFDHAFGITTPDLPIEKIVLRFSKTEAPYILSLPIHKSQKVLKQNNDYLDISIEVIPCYELFEFILGKTPDVKVLSPQSLAIKISSMLESGKKNYK